MLAGALRLALVAIGRNPVRSFLTVLGVVIGVAAVITMVTLGNGATAAVSQQISSLGSNLLNVRSGQRLGPGGAGAPAFKAGDVEAIRARIPGLAAVTGLESGSGPIVYGAQNWSSMVAGADRPYFTARKLSLAEGRIFTEAEERSGKPVCVLGETVRRELFGRANPVGTRIRVRTFGCLVIGLLAPSKEAAMGQDQDDIVIMPLRTLQRRISGSLDIGQIVIAVGDAAGTDQAKEALTRLLRERRHIAYNEDDNFNILDMRQIAEAISGTTRVMTMLLAAVAAVSLLVGGIGIMNIMLVSVTERTREIGIRLAIGALERDVLLQFLVEAMTLSAMGGLFGVALGAVASMILTGVMKVPYVFDLGVNCLAVMTAATIGIFFGYFPARRAARLNPIEALRHE